MSTCAKCRNQLPANAEHCVFCGAPSVAVTPLANPADRKNEDPKSTMMGHPGILEELQLALEEKQRLSPDFDGAKTPEAASPEAARKVYNQAEIAATTPAEISRVGTQRPAIPPIPPIPPRQASSPPQQPSLPQGLVPPRTQVQQQPTPVPQASPPEQQIPQPCVVTVPPQPIPANSLPPTQHQAAVPLAVVPQQPIPANSLPPTQHQSAVPMASPLGANFGMGDARFGAESAQAPPSVIPYRESFTEKVKPLPAPESLLDEKLSSADTWDESLITVLLVFGVILVACFVAPWSIGTGENSTVFAWTVLSVDGASLGAKIAPLLILATGLAAIGAGALELRPGSRALAAICIGISPVGFTLANASSFDWRGVVWFVGTVLIVGGLHLRSRYQEPMLPRILVTASALLLLSLYLIPIGGTLPVIALLDVLSDSSGVSQLLPILGLSTGNLTLGILPLTVIVLTFLVWMPSFSPALMKSLAIFLLFGGLFAALAGPLLGQDVVATLKAQLSSYLFLPLAATAWLVMTSFGIRTLVEGKIRTS